MPDSCCASVCNKLTIFSICPSAGTVKINPTFHQAIFEIPHSILSFPWTYCITCQRLEMTVNSFQSCTIHCTQCHLVSVLSNLFLPVCSIQRTINCFFFLKIKSKTVDDRKIEQ